MSILVAFERSGRVRDAFLELGYDAVSCDLEPTESPGPHIQGDARPLLKKRWDLVIAHPPCTFLAVSRGRMRDFSSIAAAADLFIDCLTANAPYIAVENPKMYRAVQRRVGSPSFWVQPFQFGDPYRKLTYFWTRNLPPLLPTSYTGESTRFRDFQHWAGGAHGLHRDASARARTFPGIAKAIAQQYGSLLS